MLLARLYMQAPSHRICMHAKIEGMLALESELRCIGFVTMYVKDTLTIMSDKTSAANFLPVLNNCHTSPFLECSSLTELPILKPRSTKNLLTRVFLLHSQTHVDMRYKRGLLNHALLCISLIVALVILH